MQTRTILAALVAAPLLTGLGFAFGPGLSTAATPAAPSTSSAAAPTFNLDLAHSHVLFRTEHLGLSYAHGRFNTFGGKFELGDSPSIEIEIDAASVDTQNEKRDSHLKNADFLNAGEFPKISFKSTKIESAGEDRYTGTGKLTLLGKEQEVSFEAVKVGEGDSPWDDYRAGLHASFTIKRSDFGMNWGLESNSVGDEILLEVSVEGIRE
jgi:polyisoprenoid-binding protein YceI